MKSFVFYNSYLSWADFVELVVTEDSNPEDPSTEITITALRHQLRCNQKPKSYNN